MHEPKSMVDDKQCDKLELAVESASNLHSLRVSGCRLLRFCIGHYHSDSGFLANIENAFCFVCS